MVDPQETSIAVRFVSIGIALASLRATLGYFKPREQLAVADHTHKLDTAVR